MLKSVMRAVVVNKFGGPEVLELAANVALPMVTGNQLRIRVRCAGVNPIDTYIRSGMSEMDLPYTPGKDGAGIVDACGEDVKRFKAGDRVYFCFSPSGSYAEYCTTIENHTFHLHNSLTFAQGASLGIPYFTAYRALVTKAGARKGQTVLIHGASGGVGIACCQIARHLGLQVFGTAGSEAGLELVQNHGANHVFNHRDKDYVEKIKEKAGEGVDIIIEMLSNVNLERDLEIVRPDGKIVVVGSRGKVEITPRHILVKEATIVGVSLVRIAEKEDWLAMGRFLDEGQREGWVVPVVGKEYGLKEVQLAHREVIEHREGTCLIVHPSMYPPIRLSV